MKKFKSRALAVAMSVAMLFTCSAAFTVLSYAEDTPAADAAAFTVTVNHFLKGEDPTKVEPLEVTTTEYTDAEFKALSEDMAAARYSRFGKGAWTVYEATHGVTLSRLMDVSGVDLGDAASIDLMAYTDGQKSLYTKTTYLDYAKAAGYSFPNTKASDDKYNVEGAVEVPNGLIATTYGTTTLKDEETIGTVAIDVSEKFATATSSAYQMCVGAKEDGSEIPEGKPFCKEVSGVVVNVCDLDPVDFTVSVEYYTPGVDVSKAEPTKVETIPFTDAQFKAINGDIPPTRYARYGKGAWTVYEVTHGITLEQLAEACKIDSTKVLGADLMAFTNGVRSLYDKETYGAYMNTTGFFFPNTKASAEAFDTTGALEVPNTLIATTYGTTTLSGVDTTLGEAAINVAEQSAAPRTSGYQMMVGAKEDGSVVPAGKPFCREVSGAVFKVYDIQDQNPTIKVKTVKVKAKKVKKAKQTVAPFNVKNAVGKVTYKKTGGSKKLTVNQTTGKVTVKKGTKKGTYKISVLISAEGNLATNPYATTKTATVRVVK